MKNQVLNIIKQLKHSNQLTKDSADKINQKLAKVNSQFQKIDHEYEILSKSLKNMDSFKWKLYQTDNNIKLYHMKQKSIKSIAIKTETFFNANIVSITTLIHQVQYAHKWMPMLNFIEEVGYIDDRSNSRIINAYFGAVGIKRALQGAVYGIDRCQYNRTCIMIIKDISEDQSFMKQQNVYDYYDKRKSDVKLKVHQMTFIFELVDAHKCKVTAIQNINFNIQFVPKFIIDYISKKSGIIMFQRIQQILTNKFEYSPWIENILNRNNKYHDKELYEIMNNISINYLEYDYIDNIQKKIQSFKKK